MCDAYLLGVFLVLQPNYDVFDKPGYAPTLLSTEPNKSRHSHADQSRLHAAVNMSVINDISAHTSNDSNGISVWVLIILDHCVINRLRHYLLSESQDEVRSKAHNTKNIGEHRRSKKIEESEGRARRTCGTCAFNVPVMCRPAAQNMTCTTCLILSADVSRHEKQVEQLVSSASQRRKLLEPWQQEWNSLGCGNWFSLILSKLKYRMTDPQQTTSFNGAFEAIDAIWCYILEPLILTHSHAFC